MSLHTHAAEYVNCLLEGASAPGVEGACCKIIIPKMRAAHRQGMLHFCVTYGMLQTEFRREVERLRAQGGQQQAGEPVALDQERARRTG